MDRRLDTKELDDLKTLVWGEEGSEEIFQRWSQGMVFSDCEPTALLQLSGGPCALLAPVQAFMIKNLLPQKKISEWKQIPLSDCHAILTLSLTQILQQASCGSYCICINGDRQACDSFAETPPDSSPVSSRRELFHNNLKLIEYNSAEEMSKCITAQMALWRESVDERGWLGECGVILFLYSLVLTKGLRCARKEMSDPSEPLIDSHGYGSQSLINLVITGCSTSFVWDGEKDLGGLKLCGVQRTSDIGYLSLLERLRFCQVGSYLKNPRNPVWILGSETHLTVIFSESKQLVSEETPSDRARRTFKHYDPDGNGFIPTSLLQDVLRALDLVDDTEYVQIMGKKLDDEGTGIILLHTFMEEFFPRETGSMLPDCFTLWHYNGLPSSNAESKVEYHSGDAVLLETEVRCQPDTYSILTCLQTKWPSIEVAWHGSQKQKEPSIN